MISCIEKYEILYKGQYGFHKSHSTQHKILDIVNSIQANMDRGLFLCGIIHDLKKNINFDTVDHSILLDKIEFYDFRTAKQWFLSYLTGRSKQLK